MEQPSERDNLISFISDVHKDARGFRPRYYDWDAMSIEELKNLADSLVIESQEEDMRLLAEAEEARKAFEATIKATIEAGAKDRTEAIQWLYNAEDDDNLQADFWVWKMGMHYSPDSKTIIDEIENAIQSKGD